MLTQYGKYELQNTEKTCSEFCKNMKIGIFRLLQGLNIERSNLERRSEIKRECVKGRERETEEKRGERVCVFVYVFVCVYMYV